MKKIITIFILTCNRPNDLKKAILSVKNQVSEKIDVDILVVDNGEDEKTKEISVELGARYTKDTKRKLSHLFNVGWKNAKSEIIGYLADDAEAQSGWLENILDTFERYPQSGAVNGPVISTCYPSGEMHRLFLIQDKNTFLKILLRPYFYFVYDINPYEPGRLCDSGAYTFGAAIEKSKYYPEQKIDLLTTTSMGIKKSALEKIGGFNENFMFNHADGDLFVRLKRAGYELIFNPKIISHHHVRLGPSRSPYMIGRDSAIFLIRDVKPQTLRGTIGWFLNIFVLNLYWIYNAIRVKQLKQLSGIMGFINGTFYSFFKYEKKN